MEQARATKNPQRKLYFWTLHWADTKYARVTGCDMTAEDATKMLVSGGIIMPMRPLRVGDPGPAKDDLDSR